MGQNSYNVATYNIRYDNPGDEGNLWKDRSPHLINLIQFHEMDIIGTQEGLYNQLEDMSRELDFPYLGVARDDGDKKGEYSAVFYNPEKFELLEHDTFWLSETPEEPSVGWDASMERICSYGKFKTKEGEKTFYVFNVHYDHRGQEARENSSKLLMEKIEEINTEHLPCILTGDFNVTDDNPAYKEIIEDGKLKDTINLAPFSHGPEGTFNAFNWDYLPERRIDYVFVSKHFEVVRHGTLSDNYGKKYPSDHFPVMAEIKF
ncbi:endonuclease/exonuclease/phosphatase family protein [Pleomorphovibrio marinus]|uniref:endonuclease/exonuclease/phosphatase family protein n=1 Tax=Pleomorphovibrio marinus TaxID=2164132 RepID=UPI001E455E33|nr:endonuclease/exonuclease/phosphatase family protein [Pleomorphovibrio marinus]